MISRPVESSLSSLPGHNSAQNRQPLLHGKKFTRLLLSPSDARPLSTRVPLVASRPRPGHELLHVRRRFGMREPQFLHVWDGFQQTALRSRECFFLLVWTSAPPVVRVSDSSLMCCLQRSRWLFAFAANHLQARVSGNRQCSLLSGGMANHRPPLPRPSATKCRPGLKALQRRPRPVREWELPCRHPLHRRKPTAYSCPPPIRSTRNRC